MADNLFKEYLPYVRHFLDEHRNIHASVDQIDADYFLSERWPTKRAEFSGKLLQDLRHLRKTLQVHFEEEEAGGVLEEAICRLPRLTAEWHVLELQHGGLLDKLDGVIEMVENQGFSGRGAEQIMHCFHAFAEMLYDHEMAETRLLEAGFNVDSEDLYCAGVRCHLTHAGEGSER
jgi:hypothetical protein